MAGAAERRPHVVVWARRGRHGEDEGYGFPLEYLLDEDEDD